MQVRSRASGQQVPAHHRRRAPVDLDRAVGRQVPAEPAGLRDELSRGAVEQAAHFSWDLTADRTIEVYRRAAQMMRQDLLAARA